jgi:pimeloyl-ACP methyl ester carboxylesterase
MGGTVVLRWQAMDPEVVAGVAWGAYAEFVPAAERLRAEYARWLPRCWVRRAAGRVPGLLGVPAASMDPVSVVGGRELRVLFVAATGDRVTPPEDSQQLIRAMGVGGRLLVVEGVTHETLPYAFEQHGEWVKKWLSGEREW